ncbi:MAG: DUF5107 domain-containing protein [Clostridia bacterium]|nr:DUF5107 domain-containing protein [Clostridia bacterium]
MIREIRFHGERAFRMESEVLSVTALPDFGGKLASIRYLPRDFEFLFQNPNARFRPATPGDDFSRFEACGFDDAFPTVDACEVMIGSQVRIYPDHGEIWSSRFEAHTEGDALVQSFKSPLFGYDYEKRFSVDGDRLRCAYRIHNPNDTAMPAIWTCHCLARAEDDMEVLMPRDTLRAINAFSGEWLGEKDASLSYPLALGPHGPVDLRRMPPSGMLKFYVDGPLTEGCCGYRYNQSGVRVTIGFDPEKLPYLGFWATSGGFRGDHNCALEPSNGFYDNIPNSQANGACPVLEPGETWLFDLEFGFELM